MRFFSLCCLKNSLTLLFILWANCLFAQNQDIHTLKKQLSLATTDSSRSQILYDIGEQYELVKVDSAFYFLNQSLVVAQKSKNQKLVAQAIHGLGFYYLYYEKDETKAVEWFKKSIEVAKKNNDNLNLAKNYHRLGIIALHQGIGDPMELYKIALSYAKKANDWKVLSDSYEIISGYLKGINKYVQAEEASLSALEIARKHDIDSWFTTGLDYCDLLELQGKQSQATAFYKQLNAAKNKLKKNKGYFVYMNDVGSLETKLKNYTVAESLFLKVLEVEKNKSKVDTFHLMFIYRNLESLYLEQEAYKKAHQASKNLEEVRLWLYKKRQTIDSKIQMTQLKANLDLEKKEVEITLLETQKKQQQLFLIASILFAILLVSFLIFLQRKKQKIELQKTELGQLNTTKDKLFAILSHDLRSPVASLKNYMMLINWGALSQAEFAESTQGLNTQVSKLHTMLENVLNWSITQMGGMKPNIEKTGVCEVIDEQIQLLRTVADAKNILIENKILPEANVFADKNHLMIIIRNLLQNAIKFTDFGGNIAINYREKGMKSIIEVKDNGIGMSAEKLKNLFHLERNTFSTGTANEQGTGLGLVLVKDLVEANNGKIIVKSELGKGTIFELNLPNV